MGSPSQETGDGVLNSLLYLLAIIYHLFFYKGPHCNELEIGLKKRLRNFAKPFFIDNISNHYARASKAATRAASFWSSFNINAGNT